jgi:hypothetical protein
MPGGRVVEPGAAKAPAATGLAVPSPWADVVARWAAAAARAAPAPATGTWRQQLAAVAARIDGLDDTSYAGSRGAADGVHALTCLVAAGPFGGYDPRRLIDVAGAVELAYRATRHHDEVVDTGDNRAPVLAGDWAITQAALLVADDGPQAYRILVRGYGAAQQERLAARASAQRVPALLRTAVALGCHVRTGDATAGAPDVAALTARVVRWASQLVRDAGVQPSFGR